VPPGQQLPDTAAQQAELKAWEKFAIKHLGRWPSREFEARELSLLQVVRIKTALGRLELNNVNPSEADVRQIFRAERVGGMAEAVAELKRFNDIASAP
jgi:hypothetical protein